MTLCNIVNFNCGHLNLSKASCGFEARNTSFFEIFDGAASFATKALQRIITKCDLGFDKPKFWLYKIK